MTSAGPDDLYEALLRHDFTLATCDDCPLTQGRDRVLTQGTLLGGDGWHDIEHRMRGSREGFKNEVIMWLNHDLAAPRLHIDLVCSRSR